MHSKRNSFIYVLSALVLLAFAMAFFERSHQQDIELATSSDELPDPARRYPNDTGLCYRICHSYGLPLILVISEYSQKNAVALEALRSWAQDKFQRDPAFLHKLVMQPPREKNYSIVDAFSYCLLGPPRLMLEEHALGFLHRQISAFHKGKAFQMFRNDYFETFGLEQEAARLLARYESDKAKLAVGVLLSAVYWSGVIVGEILLFIETSRTKRSTKAQRGLAYFWFSLSIFYLIIAWSQNAVPLFVSSLLCLAVGVFVRRPISIIYGSDEGLHIRLLSPSWRMLTLGYWITFSLLAIQMLTWIKTGTLNEPDPITLLLCSASGNFLHEPINSKRILVRVIGGIWLAATASVFSMIMGQSRTNREVEQELASLRNSRLKHDDDDMLVGHSAGSSDRRSGGNHRT